eukprot:289558-Rhodomonas_salina.3
MELPPLLTRNGLRGMVLYGMLVWDLNADVGWFGAAHGELGELLGPLRAYLLRRGEGERARAERSEGSEGKRGKEARERGSEGGRRSSEQGESRELGAGRREQRAGGERESRGRDVT